MMPIVTISRGSYSRGKEVAEKVARELGYECISRDILIEASHEFHVPEITLLRAIQEAPSLRERFSFGKERYIAYIQAALLDHFQRDNVVYHGLAGHFFVEQVSHVLKVRIIAKQEDRIKLVMEREGLSEDKAVRFLKSIDDARRKWGVHLYGIDTNDPTLYDLLIHIKKLSTDDAANLICQAIASNRFRATAESQQILEDLLLAAKVRANIIEIHPRVNVVAKEGVVHISLKAASSREEEAIRDAAEKTPGVERIELISYPVVTPD
jgi:cytidylate kinase